MSRRRPKQLLIEQLDLSVPDLHDLYGTLLLGSLHFARHDIGNSLGAILPLVQQMREDAEVQEIPALQLREDLRFLESSVRGLRHAWNITLGFGRGMTSLVARPSDIAAEIIKSKEGRAEVLTSPECNETLEILFPEPVLGGVVTELVSNAIAAGSSTVSISWTCVAFRFHLELHDDGPGISDNLSENPILLGKLHPHRNGGLYTINAVAMRNSGFVTVRRSQNLGGTALALSLPIKAFYLDGEIFQNA